MTWIFLLILLIPLICAGAVKLICRGRGAFIFLFAASAVEFILLILLCGFLRKLPEGFITHGSFSFFGIDLFSAGFLMAGSLLLLLVSVYAFSWSSAVELASGASGDPGKEDGTDPSMAACLLLFFGTAAFVSCAQNPLSLWLSSEAAVLSGAWLLGSCRRGTGGIWEMLWKYLLLCSAGLGFVFLGTVLLSTAVCQGGTEQFRWLVFSSFDILSSQMHAGWFKAAFIFLLAGYGT